jgi:CheY-like chemotaxis protein
MDPRESNQRTILFVDDDTEYLQMVERVMRLWSHDKWTVLTASSASAALAILQNQTPNLIVTDVCMPVVDGLQFLSIVHKRYPDIQKVALTGFATEAYRTACLSNGAELFLEKPRSSEGLETIFATFDELTKCKPDSGFRGVLRSVGLTEIIQMECLNKSSSILRVSGGSSGGLIYICDGNIIHAEAGAVKGEAALYKIFSLAGGEFSLKPYAEPPERTIEGQWEFLLMEAAQKRDEAPPEVPAENAASAEADWVAGIEAERQGKPAAAERGRINIEELMICSDLGDVLLSWQCNDADSRVSFLEFISQKARLLRNALPLGAFDRVEFLGPNGRMVSQIGSGRGIVVRSSSSNFAGPLKSNGRAPTLTPAVKFRAETAFSGIQSISGLLAAGLHFTDGSGINRSIASTFQPDALELLRRAANDAFRLLHLQGFKPIRSRWTFEHAVIDCAFWDEGVCVALIFSRHSVELDPQGSANAIEKFLTAANSETQSVAPARNQSILTQTA